MFFNDWIQRKLAALLLPWLRDEPQLELKIGLFRTGGTLNDISFDTSALNGLLDDPSKFCFKEATVQHLSLQFSPFSSAAFTLVVRGLRIVLSLGEEVDERGVKWRIKPKETTVEERNKILQEIDPEGCALHGAIKKILDITTRTWRTSLLNTVVRHCQLQLLDIHVILQSPSLHDPLSCSLYMTKFEARPRIVGHRCFTRGFMSSLFLPSGESSFDVDVNSFEIRLNSENHMSCVVPATNMFVLVDMNHLQFISFCFRVRELNFLFSPADLSVMLLLFGLLSKESKRARPGRQLWNVAANRISSLLPTSNLSLIEIVRILCLCLRYIKTYRSILLLVGYPADEIMKRSATMMFRDARYSRFVKSQWKAILGMENNMPLEAIVLARRIIRLGVASSGPGENESYNELVPNRLLSKLRQLFMLTLSTICSFLYLVIRILFLHKVLEILLEGSQHFGSVREHSLLQQSISLNVDEISVTLSPDNVVRPSIRRKVVSDTRMLCQDLVSFHLSLDGFCLRYIETVSEQSLTFASGSLNVLFSPSEAGAGGYAKENQEKEGNERQIIVWGEPAQIYSREATHSNATGDTVPHLDYLLGKLWLNWKDFCLNFEGENLPNLQTPWVLCEIRSFLTYENLSSRFWNCSFIVGKLNFNLECFSIASITVLHRQIQCALCLSQKGKNNVLPQTPKITDSVSLVRDSRSKFRSFSMKTKMDLIRVLPERHVQIGALIAGPHIQISLSKNQFHAETTSNDLVTQMSLDLCNIELLVSPNLEDNLGFSSESKEKPDKEPEYFGLEEPQQIDIPESDRKAYSCQGKISLNAYLKFDGLKAYFHESTGNQEYHIVVLSPITTQLQYVRKEHHSFDSSIVAFSAAFRWVATGFSSLIFLDELHILTKIFCGVLCESLASPKDGSRGGINSEEDSSKETIYIESEIEETSSNRSNQTLLVADTQFIVRGTCEIKSFDIVFHTSREVLNIENYMNIMPSDRETCRKLTMHGSSGSGIHISVQQSIVEFICSGGNIDIVIDTIGVKLFIFRYLTESKGNFDKSNLKNFLCSLNLLAEASVTHCKLSLCLKTSGKALPSASLHTAADASGSHGKTLHMLGESSSSMNTERLGDHWLSVNIVFSGLYMVECQIKDTLVNGNDFEKLNISFSAGGDFQAISCQSKGGSVLFEATAAVMLIECFSYYYSWILELCPAGRSSGIVEVGQCSREMAALNGHPSANPQKVHQQDLLWDPIEVVSMSLSHLSLVVVARDESDKVQQLLFEVDFHLNLEKLDTVQKISMSISRLSLVSQFMHEAIKQKAMLVQNPLLSHVAHLDSSSNFRSNNFSVPLQHGDESVSGIAGASGSSPSVFQEDSKLGGSPGQKNFCISPPNYILRNLQCSIAVEGPVTGGQISPAYSNSIWIGNGSMSGFNMTLSLSEIKMVLSAFESISEVLVKEETYKSESMHCSYNQEWEGSIEEMVADGTIVFIQDFDQHMYITVEGAESKYDIAGAIHYSLVGERALFRVKYHKSRWSQVQYFSLSSLYAKDKSGEPLQLACKPSSRFVDILCSGDGGCALWRMEPFKPDAYEGATELESSCSLSKGMFHLVNKKNNCAVAFIDGTLEFVGKPGNLFKWKVFGDPGTAGNNLLPNRYLVEGPSVPPTTGSRELLACQQTGFNQQSDLNATDTGKSWINCNPLGITITVDNVTLTIVHEISDTEEKFPLLQGSVIFNQVIVQILNSKVRFMNTVEVTLCYFDARQNSWREFIQPLEICIYYCFKFLIQHPEDSLQKVPSHFYAKIKEVTILMSELSLDILLFLIGKLDLAGPYAIKSSMVLANCCKVENQSGLALLCQLHNQEASVSARQSTTIFLRNLTLPNQPLEAPFISIQLCQQSSLSTSPFHLSLSEAREFAWRTRIVSSQDSKSFPGPFIVIGISRSIENGLSVVVSPLLRIHNETDFYLELRFQRPDHKEKEHASVMLKSGDVMDDAMAAFSAIDLSGGFRKALTSLSVGNYEFSFRPNFANDLKNIKISRVEWSDDLKGGKPVHLSGIFDKLSYQVRKAFSVDSLKVSLNSANCALKSEDGFVTDIYFLVQTVGKDIPLVHPDNSGYAPANRNSPVAMQEQKEVFILPTIQVVNKLHSEIHVNLTDTEPHTTIDHGNPWSQATIPCGSTVNFYVNPATMYFVVTLTSFGSRCLPVNSGDWIRKLQKQKGNIRYLDIELDFGGGKYFAMLRLSRGQRGTLKAVVFTSYTLQNGTNTSLFCFAANQKPLHRSYTEISSLGITPDLGSYLLPNSITSWFLKCHKLHFKLLEEKALEAQLDLDALSGPTEIDLESEGTFGSKNITRLGVSLKPSINNEVSSHLVSLSSRYVLANESDEAIVIRQCYAEETEELIAINSKQRVALKLKAVKINKKVTSVVENLLRKHTKSENDLSLFIQFRSSETGFGWSGPICVASLGRFFLKFRKSVESPERQLNHMSDKNNLGKFAAVHVVEEGSTIVLHFHMPPLANLPYRIENFLHGAPITYYQKGSAEPETLGAGASVDYVWDDPTLPHKLVIQLVDVHLLREINIDKVRAWKPFYRNKQTRGLGFHFPLDKRPEDSKQTTYSQLIDTEMVKVGYEVYAEGITRVLRICVFSESRKVNIVPGSSTKMRLRISYLAVHLLEQAQQEIELGEPFNYSPVIIARLERLNLDSMFTDDHKYNQIRVQSLSVDEKWVGAPFAAILRRHRSENYDANDDILYVAVVLLPTSSGVKQVKYLSIVLQPLDLNLDEETLMKIVPFWRTSLSESNSPRQQYYFDHFEIHPIKIVASFLPGDSQYSYNSTQETLRSLLHSVLKIPAIKSKTVELNGVLVTHALITLLELTVKCAQHYSWYAMRAIYIAQGSPLLPPAFASIFDDSASSSLDVFFDPSSGLLNLPGVTIGTFKLISKIIDNKGLSGTKRYLGDMGKTLKTAGSNMLFAAITEISDSVLKGAETSGFKGMGKGFHQGILKLAMEPSVLSSAFMEGGPDRKIKLDRSPGVDELYIEGYLQAMLDTVYKQEYLRVRVIENQVILKNLPPSSSLIDEIMERVKDYLASKALLKAGSSTSANSLRHIRGEREWRIGPTVLTLCEHLFVSFAIQMLRKQAGKAVSRINWKEKTTSNDEKAIVPTSSGGEVQKVKLAWKWGIGKFVFSGIVAYVDGRLCRNIPHPLARRIVSGFLLSFLDKSDDEN